MSARSLRLTSPAMRGSDVKLFQHDLNAELGRWGISYRIAEDGVYGPSTRDMADSVCYGLGLGPRAMDHGATPAVRLKVRNRKLSKTEKARFDTRADWRTRLHLRLDRIGLGDSAARRAIQYAIDHIGVTESPAGSNRGALIDKWCRACGVLAAPWCGCFANACLVAAGFPDQPWLKYCPAIEGIAKSGQGGWSWHSTAEIGDLVLYGASIAQHVGLVTEVSGGRDTATCEGNTSNGPGGSQANGGIVAKRHRHTDGSLAALPIRGYARPPYAKVA